jgi:hypothetical protein
MDLYVTPSSFLFASCLSYGEKISNKPCYSFKSCQAGVTK